MNLQLKNIYTARETVLYNMKQQGYNTLWQSVSLKELEILEKTNQLDMLLETSISPESTPIHKTYIRFLLDTKVSIRNIQKMIDDLYDTTQMLSKSDTLYIVSINEPNDGINTYLQQLLNNSGIFIVIESIYRLQYVILAHKIVPKHTVLSDTEEAEFLAHYRISDKTKLPKIKRNDPVARALCIRPGKIICVDRPSRTAVIAKHYCICY